jgi:hypothetical protein
VISVAKSDKQPEMAQQEATKACSIWLSWGCKLMSQNILMFQNKPRVPMGLYSDFGRKI